VPLLTMLKPEEEPLTRILPRQGPLDPFPQGMHSSLNNRKHLRLGRLRLHGLSLMLGNHARLFMVHSLFSGQFRQRLPDLVGLA
jgi:hypothetical protein